MELPFLVVSDIHLGGVPEETEGRFRRFLASVAGNASGLLINGDLFDFWFEYRSVVPAKHYRVLAALKDLTESGIPVWFVGGNHDAWGGRFLEEEVGLQLIEGPVEMMVGGRRALVAHGDGVGRGDLGYRILRRFIRNPITVAAFRALHPDLGDRIANRVSTTEQKSEGMDDSLNRAAWIREWGIAMLEANPSLELVLAGHAHHPEIIEVRSGAFFVNSGDWINHFTYVELPADGGQPRLLTWE